jgi:hypothetical protein
MKSLRITIGLAVSAIALAIAAAPAMALKEKPKIPTGNFIASVAGGPITPEHPVIAKSHEGAVEEMKFGGMKFHCKGLSSTSEITSEKSPDLAMDLNFKSCKHAGSEGLFAHQIGLHFKKPLHLELHANGSVKIMKIGANESEAKVQGFTCLIKIPAQEIPLQAEKKEGEFEAVGYSTTKETVEGAKLKTFPRGFYETLEVEFIGMKHLKFEYKPEPPIENEKHEKEFPNHCGYTQGEGGSFDKETGMVEGTWAFEGAVSGIQIKKGSIGFEPPV